MNMSVSGNSTLSWIASVSAVLGINKTNSTQGMSIVLFNTNLMDGGAMMGMGNHYIVVDQVHALNNSTYNIVNYWDYGRSRNEPRDQDAFRSSMLYVFHINR
jgi:hypothetical protein